MMVGLFMYMVSGEIDCQLVGYKLGFGVDWRLGQLLHKR